MRPLTRDHRSAPLDCEMARFRLYADGENDTPDDALTMRDVVGLLIAKVDHAREIADAFQELAKRWKTDYFRKERHHEAALDRLGDAERKLDAFRWGWDLLDMGTKERILGVLSSDKKLASHRDVILSVADRTYARRYFDAVEENMP